MGIEGLEPSRSKKSTDFHENLCFWTFSLSFIFLYLSFLAYFYLLFDFLKDSFHKVSAPFVLFEISLFLIYVPTLTWLKAE
jgi:hypothetical protein